MYVIKHIKLYLNAYLGKLSSMPSVPTLLHQLLTGSSRVSSNMNVCIHIWGGMGVHAHCCFLFLPKEFMLRVEIGA